jgi:hypothetical protein
MIYWKRKSNIRKQLQRKEKQNDNAINDNEVFPKRLSKVELFEKIRQKQRKKMRESRMRR